MIALVESAVAYTLQLTVALKRYCLQISTIVESVATYACDSTWNCYSRQTTTTIESIVVYFRNRTRNCNVYQTATTRESVVAYALQLTITIKRYSLQVDAIVESTSI